jgi:hypothetical protein
MCAQKLMFWPNLYRAPFPLVYCLFSAFNSRPPCYGLGVSQAITLYATDCEFATTIPLPVARWEFRDLVIIVAITLHRQPHHQSRRCVGSLRSTSDHNGATVGGTERSQKVAGGGVLCIVCSRVFASCCYGAFQRSLFLHFLHLKNFACGELCAIAAILTLPGAT